MQRVALALVMAENRRDAGPSRRGRALATTGSWQRRNWLHRRSVRGVHNVGADPFPARATLPSSGHEGTGGRANWAALAVLTAVLASCLAVIGPAAAGAAAPRPAALSSQAEPKECAPGVVPPGTRIYTAADGTNWCLVPGTGTLTLAPKVVAVGNDLTLSVAERYAANNLGLGSSFSCCGPDSCRWG